MSVRHPQSRESFVSVVISHCPEKDFLSAGLRNCGRTISCCWERKVENKDMVVRDALVPGGMGIWVLEQEE